MQIVPACPKPVPTEIFDPRSLDEEKWLDGELIINAAHSVNLKLEECLYKQSKESGESGDSGKPLTNAHVGMHMSSKIKKKKK